MSPSPERVGRPASSRFCVVYVWARCVPFVRIPALSPPRIPGLIGRARPVGARDGSRTGRGPQGRVRLPPIAGGLPLDTLGYPLITSSDAHFPEHVARRPFPLDVGAEELQPRGPGTEADIGALRAALAKRRAPGGGYS